MTTIPKNELRALGNPADMKSVRIMELGNKKNPSGLYRDWYEAQGAAYFCTDINGQDGAIPWDIREPAPEYIKETGPFDIVTNFGFTEHVQDRQAECWENLHRMVHPAYGQLSCVLPQPGYWVNHGKPKGFPGRWYPYPEFFDRFAFLNGYVIEDLWTCEKQHLVCCRMFRTAKHHDFYFPAVGMFDNLKGNK